MGPAGLYAPSGCWWWGHGHGYGYGRCTAQKHGHGYGRRWTTGYGHGTARAWTDDGQPRRTTGAASSWTDGRTGRTLQQSRTATSWTAGSSGTAAPAWTSSGRASGSAAAAPASSGIQSQPSPATGLWQSKPPPSAGIQQSQSSPAPRCAGTSSTATGWLVPSSSPEVIDLQQLFPAMLHYSDWDRPDTELEGLSAARIGIATAILIL